jgi:hypothetical protein
MIKSKKFWGWMEKMGYGYKGVKNKYFIVPKDNIAFPAEPALLTGRMIEYLILKPVISFRRLGGWLEEEIKMYLMLKKSKYGLDQPAEIVYEILKEKIEECDNGNNVL